MFTYRYRELAVALENKGEVRLALAKTLRVNPEEIFNLEVERFSLDSRRKGDLHWSYNVVFDLKRKVRATGNNARGLIESKREIRSLDAEPLKDTVAMASHVDVIGAGPSGLWAALHLLRKGFSVDIYEQGKQVEERFRDIRKFFDSIDHRLLKEKLRRVFDEPELLSLLDQIIDSHRFDIWPRTAGAGAAICTDCGYMLLFASPDE